jgi:GDP-D-mannose dehydratase
VICWEEWRICVFGKKWVSYARPYEVSLESADWIAINSMEVFNLYTSCGVLFNQERYLRDENFFVRSNAPGIETISGKADKLEVRKIDIICDFRSAGNKLKPCMPCFSKMRFPAISVFQTLVCLTVKSLSTYLIALILCLHNGLSAKAFFEQLEL